MCAPLHYVLYGQENPHVYKIYKGKNGLARPLRGFLTQMEVQTGTDSFRSAFIYINWDLRGGETLGAVVTGNSFLEERRAASQRFLEAGGYCPE